MPTDTVSLLEQFDKARLEKESFLNISNPEQHDSYEKLVVENHQLKQRIQEYEVQVASLQKLIAQLKGLPENTSSEIRAPPPRSVQRNKKDLQIDAVAAPAAIKYSSSRITISPIKSGNPPKRGDSVYSQTSTFTSSEIHSQLSMDSAVVGGSSEILSSNPLMERTGEAPQIPSTINEKLSIGSTNNKVQGAEGQNDATILNNTDELNAEVRGEPINNDASAIQTRLDSPKIVTRQVSTDATLLTAHDFDFQNSNQKKTLSHSHSVSVDLDEELEKYSVDRGDARSITGSIIQAQDDLEVPRKVSIFGMRTASAASSIHSKRSFSSQSHERITMGFSPEMAAQSPGMISRMPSTMVYSPGRVSRAPSLNVAPLNSTPFNSTSSIDRAPSSKSSGSFTNGRVLSHTSATLPRDNGPLSAPPVLGQNNNFSPETERKISTFTDFVSESLGDNLTISPKDKFKSPSINADLTSSLLDGEDVTSLYSGESDELNSVIETPIVSGNVHALKGPLDTPVLSAPDRRGADPAFETPPTQQLNSPAHLHQEAFGDVVPNWTSLSEPSPVKSQASSVAAPRYESDIPLFIQPNELGTVSMTVVSTIQGDKNEPSMLFSVVDKGSAKQIFGFKKTLAQIMALDRFIKESMEATSLPPLPERAAFSTNIPVRVEARRQRLNDYWSTLFACPLPASVRLAVAEFMSTDTVIAMSDMIKDGYLMIRRNKLGSSSSWKIRFCALDGPLLLIYDGTNITDTVKLRQCTVEINASNPDDKNGTTYGFSVNEHRSLATSKYFFCAETSKDRTEWIEALSRFVEGHQMPTEEEDEKKTKKRSFFRTKAVASSGNSVMSAGSTSMDGNTSLEISSPPLSPTKEALTRSIAALNLAPTAPDCEVVFGNTVSGALKLSSHTYSGVEIPSVVYRCLEYLRKYQAVEEEGIFRLSGSSALIRTLADEFDTHYDVDLLQWNEGRTTGILDINSAAGLLKLYLRKLPPVLNASFRVDMPPREMALHFQTLCREKMKTEVFSLLRVLFQYLREIRDNSQYNKMNLRNLCIVFSPTLNIPVNILQPFIVDYECIFNGGEPMGEDRESVDVCVPLS